jgi:hypothetical protein
VNDEADSMNDLVVNVDEENTRLTEKLSDQYARNAINIEEYERLVDYINKIETKKEIVVVENIIQGYSSDHAVEAPVREETSIFERRGGGEHTAIFSMRTTTLESRNGKGGTFVSLFGTNKIIADKLPPGKTVIHLETIFGSTEIVVSRSIKIINKAGMIFSGTFGSEEAYDSSYEKSHSDERGSAELVIKGDVVFGNITIIRK